MNKTTAAMDYLKFIPINDPGITQVIKDVAEHVGCSEAVGWEALKRLKSIRNEISHEESEFERTNQDLSFLYYKMMEMITKFRKLNVNFPFSKADLGRIRLIEEYLEKWEDGKTQ